MRLPLCLKQYILAMFGIIGILLCVSCSFIPADSLNGSAANNVELSLKQPTLECQYIGHVFGTQGNMVTGYFTSNLDLSLGAMNNLRNQAAENDANYVYFGQMYATNQDVFQTALGLNALTKPLQIVNGNFSITYHGEAFYCPRLEKNKGQS